jgi:hypothetical protein
MYFDEKANFPEVLTRDSKFFYLQAHRHAPENCTQPDDHRTTTERSRVNRETEFLQRISTSYINVIDYEAELLARASREARGGGRLPTVKG